MRSTILGCLALLACSPGPHAPDPIPIGDYTYAVELLDWRLDALIDGDEVPGVAVALLDGRDVVALATRGVTEVDAGEQVDDDTVWRVGSINKLLTAVEVMRLVDDGVVGLDDPVTTYLPEFSVRTREVDGNPITLRSLLAHRSGVPRNSGLPTWYWDPGTDIVQAEARELALWYAANPVGERYHYSNAGFEVLAAVVETQRGPWLPWVYEGVFAPLGLDHSALLFDDLDGASVAVGHELTDAGQVPLPQGDIITLASGAWFASLPDLAEWASRFLDNDGALLGDAAMAEMLEVQYGQPRDPQEMGLGWFTTSRRLPARVVFHNGTNQGTETMVALLPDEGVGVIAVGNSTRFAELYGDLTVELLEVLLETKTGTRTEQPDDDNTVRLSDDELDRYVGRYVCDRDLLSVHRSGGRLKVEMGEASLRLLPLGNHRFRLHHWLADPGDIEATFFVGDSDEQDVIVLDLARMEHRICPRYPDVGTVPALWQQIAGSYTVVPRVESAWFEQDTLGEVDATIEDGALHLGALWVWPDSPSELRVIGGQWDGETVLRDPDTGRLTFQSEVDVPKPG